MQQETLFLRTLDDLREKVASADEYEILKAAGLIRLLLIDGTPLVDKVNRSIRLKLEYEYVGPRTGAGAGVLSLSPDSLVVADGLYPGTQIADGNIVKTNARKFLGELALVSGGIEHTVRYLVKFVANELGGVHHGDPQPDTLHDLKMVLDRIPAVVYGVKAIASVVLDGLKPLEDGVRAAEALQCRHCSQIKGSRHWLSRHGRQICQNTGHWQVADGMTAIAWNAAVA